MPPSRLEQLNKLLALDPNDTFVLYGLAQEHSRAGHHDDAVAFYRRCLAIDPAYCYAYYHMAKSLAAAGQLAEARRTVSDGIRAASLAGDGKATGELSTLQIELSEMR